LIETSTSWHLINSSTPTQGPRELLWCWLFTAPSNPTNARDDDAPSAQRRISMVELDFARSLARGNEAIARRLVEVTQRASQAGAKTKTRSPPPAASTAAAATSSVSSNTRRGRRVNSVLATMLVPSQRRGPTARRPKQPTASSPRRRRFDDVGETSNRRRRHVDDDGDDGFVSDCDSDCSCDAEQRQRQLVPSNSFPDLRTIASLVPKTRATLPSWRALNDAAAEAPPTDRQFAATSSAPQMREQSVGALHPATPAEDARHVVAAAEVMESATLAPAVNNLHCAEPTAALASESDGDVAPTLSPAQRRANDEFRREEAAAQQILRVRGDDARRCTAEGERDRERERDNYYRLTISRAHLRKNDLQSKRDSLCAVYVSSGDSDTSDTLFRLFEYAGQTETIQNEHDPRFATPVIVTVPSGGAVKVHVYDCDVGTPVDDSDLLGIAQLTAAQLTQSRDSLAELPLLTANGEQEMGDDGGASTISIVVVKMDAVTAAVAKASNDAAWNVAGGVEFQSVVPATTAGFAAANADADAAESDAAAMAVAVAAENDLRDGRHTRIEKAAESPTRVDGAMMEPLLTLPRSIEDRWRDDAADCRRQNDWIASFRLQEAEAANVAQESTAVAHESVRERWLVDGEWRRYVAGDAMSAEGIVASEEWRQ
jgi:hypothetical protein